MNYFVKNAGHEAQVEAVTARKAALAFLSETSRTDGAMLGRVVFVSKSEFRLSQQNEIIFFRLADLLDDLGIDVVPLPRHSNMCVMRAAYDYSDTETALASESMMVLCV